jgi:putative transposase
MPSKFDPQKHHRRSIRLPDYDYGQPSAYYITIVTCQRAMLFGKIVNEEMELNHLGRIADECWRQIPDHFPHVELGAYVIMPNHLHGIIILRADASASARRGTIHLPRPQVLGIVPLPSNFRNLLLVQFPPLFAHIRPPLHAV